MDAIKQSFEKIAELAKANSARVELLISSGEELSIGFQKQKMNDFASTTSQMAGFRVLLGASQGYAYTENLTYDSLLRTYKEALSNAKLIESSERLPVALVKPVADSNKNFSEFIGLYNDESIAMDKKIGLAKSLEETCLQIDPRIQSIPHSKYNEGIRSTRILNSEGLDQEYKTKYYVAYAYPVAKEGDSTKSDGESLYVRNFFEINVEQLATDSVKKALSRLNAQKIISGNYPVVIDRSQFTAVLRMISDYFSAKEVFEGKSLFQNKLESKIASEKFELIDDPFEMRGTAVRPFDDEGAISKKTVLFKNGVLKNYLTNSEYAAVMNLPHTAHASRSPASELEIGTTNLVMTKGHKNLGELLSAYPKIIHLTKFSGLHAGFKSSTGDFSLPAEGFLYENGKCVSAIDRFVISGNVLDLLRDIEEIGNEYNKPGSSMICPDVLVKSLSFAGA